jgi:hypothetical protein
MATTPAEDELRRSIDLKILSPSAEASGGLRFPNTPLSTTIAQLKSKIRDELPTHPPLERLRLIYLGRASRDSESLVEVLGRNVVDQNTFELQASANGFFHSFNRILLTLCTSS